MVGRSSGSTHDADPSLHTALRLPHAEEENVRLVLLPASVADRKGRVVRGLSREDFRLFEDRVPQRIKYFSVEDLEPIEIGFLLDISGSMRQVGKLEEAKEAIRYFLGILRPQDRFALICFADEQVSWVTDFTSDRERFLERLAAQEAFGQTAIHDAVSIAPELVRQAAPGRKAILLITDGLDNASRLTLLQAIELARKTSVPIYSIGFATVPRELMKRGEVQTNLEMLDLLSRETGGVFFEVRDPDDLKEAVARIGSELRYQYVIGYAPTREAWDGSYRRVRLEARRRGLEVRTRAGYYANP